MPSSSHGNIKRLHSGDTTLSAGTWNSFVRMYNDMYRTNSVAGDPLKRPVPPILQGSTIALARLKEDAEAVGAFQPVRIVKVFHSKDIVNSLPTYEVEPVDDATAVDLHGQYAFTLSEGVGTKSGGRVVISGVAIVSVTVDEMLTEGDVPITGGYDSSYYTIDDTTLSSEATKITPVGHYKILSWFDPAVISGSSMVGTDKLFIAIDMASHSSTFMVDLDDAINPSVGDTEIDTWSSGEGVVWYSEHTTDAAAGTLEVLTDEIVYKVTVYNTTRSAIPAGKALVTYSKEYNRYIVVLQGNVTFPVELTQTGGTQGTSTLPCSYTYTVKLWEGDGSIIKADADIVALPNHYRRPNFGQLEAATFGTATYNSANELVIIDCNETLIFSTC